MMGAGQAAFKKTALIRRMNRIHGFQPDGRNNENRAPGVRNGAVCEETCVWKAAPSRNRGRGRRPQPWRALKRGFCLLMT